MTHEASVPLEFEKTRARAAKLELNVMTDFFEVRKWVISDGKGCEGEYIFVADTLAEINAWLSAAEPYIKRLHDNKEMEKELREERGR